MFNTNSEEGMKCHAIKNKRLKQNKYTLRHFVTFFSHFDGFACIHEIVMCHFTSFVLL